MTGIQKENFSVSNSKKETPIFRLFSDFTFSFDLGLTLFKFKGKQTLDEVGHLNSYNKDGNTILTLLCSEDSRHSVEMLQYLLENGADPNFSTLGNKDTPLHCLLLGQIRHSEKITEMTKKLIEHGASLNLSNREGNLPLTLAAHYDMLPVISCFLKNEADINRVGENHHTPLFSAFIQGNLNSFKFLLEQGANLTALDEAGEDLFSQNSSPNPTLQALFEQTKLDKGLPQNQTKSQTFRL